MRSSHHQHPSSTKQSTLVTLTAIIPTDSYEEAFKLPAAGNHDAVVAQQIVGLQIVKKMRLDNVIPVHYENIATLKPMALKLDGFEQKFCFAVAKDDHQPLSLLNEGLAVIQLNGTYQSLYEKWFAPILSTPELHLKEVVKNLLYILVPTLLILTLIGIWYLNRLVSQKTCHLKREIGERRRIENELIKSNDRYVKAQEIGKVGNGEYDVIRKKHWGSTEAIRMFGFQWRSSVATKGCDDKGGKSDRLSNRDPAPDWFSGFVFRASSF